MLVSYVPLAQVANLPRARTYNSRIRARELFDRLRSVHSDTVITAGAKAPLYAGGTAVR